MFSPAYESGNDDDKEPDIVGAAQDSINHGEYDEDVHTSGGQASKGRASKLPPKNANSKKKSLQDRTRSD